MIKLTFEFSDQQAALDFLAGCAMIDNPNGVPTSAPVAVAAPASAVESPKRGRPRKSEPGAVPAAQAAVEAAVAPKPVIDGKERDATLDDVRAVFGAVCAEHGIPTGRTIMAKHGADCFSLQAKDDPATTTKKVLPPDKYNEMYLHCLDKAYVKKARAEADGA